MNNQIKLAVAAALLAAASSANAGISIPAGDWTLDIGGIVNAYYTSTRASGSSVNGPLGTVNGSGKTTSNITTGLLPNYLIVSGKTRQNDLDVGFTISIQPGASSQSGGGQGAVQENRQAFLTFGDASWGSVKAGKDLGVFASDAILNDMTLLGVGSGAGGLAGNTTTLGRIGTGYMYADWKSQIAYSTPNFNGFNATVAVTQSWNASGLMNHVNGALALGATNTVGSLIDSESAVNTQRGGSEPAFEGKASYEWTGDVAGKVWVSGITQKVKGLVGGTVDQRAEGVDIGAAVNVAGFGITAYYYDASGLGQTIQLANAFDLLGNKRDSNGGYVQATYVLPTKTKLGVSWGESRLNGTTSDATTFNQVKDEMWTVGAYHPLTKHLNLVAEYSDVKHTVSGANALEGKAQTVSLGAILFF